MAITVKWDGQLVGEFEYGQLISGTTDFQNMWTHFQLNGIAQMGPPDPPSPDENLLGDSVYVSYELGVFLADLKGLGFEVQED